MALVRAEGIAQDSRDRARRLSRLGGGLLLLAAVALAYVPVYQADFLDVLDDGEYVKFNPLLRSADGLRRIWLEPRATPQYYPLVHTSFWLEYRAWGLRPGGYHAVNVALHGLNAVLLWRLLAALGLPGAGLAAGLFALHPVHVESVAWITERKNVLSGFFYLAAMLCALPLLPARGPEGRSRGGPASSPGWWGRYAAATALFACALLCKTVTVTLPVALLIVIWWKRGRVTAGDLLPLAPWLALGAALALFTAALERGHVGAQGPEWALSLVERTLIAGRAFWFYLGKLLAPFGLTFIYPRWRIDAGEWRQYLSPALAALALAGLGTLARAGRRGGFAAAALFLVTLAPALGYVNFYPMRYSFVADHFQYLASIAPLALAAALYAAWIAPGAPAAPSAFPRGAGGIAAALAIPALVLAALGILTWRQSAHYRDQESLARQNIRVNPRSWMGYNTVASALSARGRIDEALRMTEQSLRIEPADPGTLIFHGELLRNRRRFDEAAGYFREALRHDPDNAAALRNLAETERIRSALAPARRAGGPAPP